jgi:hypothetical protein
MPPQWVEIVPSVEKFIAEYRYGRDSNSRISLSPEEVLHFKRPNPESLYYGMGKVEAAWNVAELNLANHDMDFAMAKNRARPDYLATIQNTDASEDAIAEFERAVNEKLRGPEKQGGFIALTGQVDLKPMQFAPKDLAGRDEIVEEIAAVFGVPVSMLKANDPNLASATTGFAQWRESTILPLLRLDEETLNQKLLPMFGIEDSAILAYDDPVPANRQLDLQEHTGLVAAGVMTINEVRESRGLDALDLEEANVPIIGGIPLSPLDEVPEPTSAPATGTSPEDPSKSASVEPPSARLGKQEIQTAQEILSAVADGAISPPAATALLVALGFEATQAESMVTSQKELRSSPVATISANVTDVGKAVAESAPERYSDIDFTPTAEMAAEAERGLRLRREFNRGGTEVGVARAVQLSNREVLSPETVRRMSSYFARHAVDRRSGWDDPENPSAGFIAHLLWGGDAGRDWSERVVARMDRADDEEKGIDAKGALEDCVAEKLPGLLAEGYDQEQALAIAYSKCGEKSAGCECGSSHATSTKTVRQSDVLDGTSDMVELKAPFANRAEERIIRRLERELGKIGREEIRRVIREIKASGAVGEEIVERAIAVLQDEFIVREIQVRVEPYLKEAVGIGFEDGKDGVEEAIRRTTGGTLPESISFDEAPVVDWSRTRAADLVDDFKRTTSIRVSEILEPMVEQGATVDEMSDALEEKGFDAARARRIARTETSRAMNRGTVEAWKQSSVVRGKRWMAAPNACPFCQTISDRGESKGIEQDFLQVGDSVTAADGKTFVVDYDAVSGPPLHPNCRCTLSPVLTEESE